MKEIHMFKRNHGFECYAPVPSVPRRQRDTLLFIEILLDTPIVGVVGNIPQRLEAGQAYNILDVVMNDKIKF